MNCFYHPSSVAVGVCKSCGKGLCPDCAVDLGKGLACRAHCEGDVAEQIRLIEGVVLRQPGNEQVLTSVRATRRRAALFQILFGLGFLICGIYFCFTSTLRAGNLLFIFIGLLSAGFGAVSFRQDGRSLRTQATSAP